MNIKLLPQDIHLLAMKWSEPEHIPLDESLGPLAWRKQYQLRLELAIANWLAKGLLAYQIPLRRANAFVPISHLVGTSRDSVSYIDSLIDIAKELKTVRDPLYQRHPYEAFQQDDFVLLGECFNGGIAKTAEILVHTFGEDTSQQEQCFQAFVDALTLIQAVKPHNASSALYMAWSELQGNVKTRFDEVSEAHPWVIEHAFALACYPLCNIATSPEIKSVIDGLQSIARKRHVPTIFKSDLKACKDLFSIGKQLPIERIPLVQAVSLGDVIPSSSLGTIASRYPNNKIAPRYRYANVGECYAG